VKFIEGVGGNEGSRVAFRVVRNKTALEHEVTTKYWKAERRGKEKQVEEKSIIENKRKRVG
jgi:hypothetical protein